MKQCTLHGVQGKTATPGMIAHWAFPPGLSAKSIWLAYYVILSRPTSLQNLLSFGLPKRKIIEGGPPEEITEAFNKFFTDKIAYTKCEKRWDGDNDPLESWRCLSPAQPTMN